MYKREGCIAVTLSSDAILPKGPIIYLEWLPKGYGPTPDDKIICAFPYVEERHGACKLGEGKRPPDIELVAEVLTKYFRGLT